ncbi:MAG: FAD:protein FMN transferase [Bacteroidia bacterium]|nr:FAD:protein FMN transferase [Bacteroidia bacterium]
MNKNLYILLLFTLIVSCGKKVKQENGYTVFKGNFLEEKYEIAYDSTQDFSKNIDSFIQSKIRLLSNSDSNSIVFSFNHNRKYTDSNQLNSELATLNTFNQITLELIDFSKGRFNPGLGALEVYWKEQYKNKNRVDWNKALCDSLKDLYYGTSFIFDGQNPVKQNTLMQVYLDEYLSGIIADKVAWLFDSVYHIKNYYINIAGDMRVSGNNGHDSYWPIKIEKPMINTQKKIEFASIPLKNYTLSNKDNFSKFHFIKGKRYSLSLDYLQGFPAKNEILSVSIMAPTAFEATLYASTCLSIGLEDSKKLLLAQPLMKAFIIFEKDGKIEHWATNNFSYTLNTKE